jgi:hypothetical protein
MPEHDSTGSLEASERAAVARLLETVARWCDDSATTRHECVQYLCGYLVAVCGDAAKLVREPGRAAVLDGLSSSLDHWSAGLANGAIDRQRRS